MLGDDDIARIAARMRGDFDLVPTLDVVLDDAQQELLRLTEEQLVVLDVIQDDERAVIDGPAGCGKTVLAVEAARRAARRGERVLLTCYNRLLAHKLQRTLADEFASDRVTIRSLYGLFTDAISQSSLAGEFDERRKAAEHNEIFRVLIPEFAYYAALEEVIARFDYLIVDEAQDVLTNDTLEVMSEFLERGVAGGRWLMFFDSNNQASVYGRLDVTLFDRMKDLARTQFLTVNCRNTRQIAYHTNLMAQPKLAVHGRVDGPPVNFVSFSSGKNP